MIGAFSNLSLNEEITNNDIDNILIQSYLMAIDNKNKNEIKNLYEINNINKIKKDIVYKMYIDDKLNSERFQFIINNCTDYFNISSSLIKKLMKDNNKKLLEILFKDHIKCFNNSFIINFLNYYKNKISISNSDLFTLVNNDKYKISTKLNKDFNQYDSSYYLFNACKSGNEAAVEFLLKHGEIGRAHV